MTNKTKAIVWFELHRPALMKKLRREVRKAQKNGRFSRIDLHHKDMNLKKENPERYNQWNPKDLQPMLQKAHIALHNSHPLSRKHTKNISKGLLASQMEREGTCFVYGEKDITVNGNTLTQTRAWKNSQECANDLKCSRQHVCNVLNTTNPLKEKYKSAKGWRLRWV